MVEPITRRHDENRNSRKFRVQGIQDDCASKWANLVLVECIDDCVVPLFAIPNNDSEIVKAFMICSGDSTESQQFISTLAVTDLSKNGGLIFCCQDRDVFDAKIAHRFFIQFARDLKVILFKTTVQMY